MITEVQDLVGKLAPQFTSPANAGKTISLTDSRSKKVILYFYPKDMTPNCTTQACDFTQMHPDFSKLYTIILGVSKDSPEHHDKFIAKHNIPFNLI